MNLTIPELIEKLSVLDEIELLEILEITSVDILNRFEDVVEDNYNRALAVYSAMKNADEPDAKIKERIGELQFNKITS